MRSRSQECRELNERIGKTRQRLIAECRKQGVPSYVYAYLTNQRGPFSRATVYGGVSEGLRAILGRDGVMNLTSGNAS